MQTGILPATGSQLGTILPIESPESKEAIRAQAPDGPSKLEEMQGYD